MINGMAYYLQAIRDEEKHLLLELYDLVLSESAIFYKERNIKWLPSPITTGSVSSPMGIGSDSLPVKILLEGRETYLSDSMQFMLEYGCRFSKNGCWYIMPSFRGEDVDDRHLKQFFHSEAEIPGDLDAVINLSEDYIRFLCKKIEEKIGEKPHITKLIEDKIPRISLDEAEKILSKDNLQYHDGYRNISNNGEKELIEYFGGPVWLTHHDVGAVPFYQKSKDGRALNADLLMGIGETVGCGERWNGGKELKQALKQHEVDEDAYRWYIEMKELFPINTSGFGMGIERFLMFILEEKDIRKMQFFRRFNDGKDVV